MSTKIISLWVVLFFYPSGPSLYGYAKGPPSAPLQRPVRKQQGFFDYALQKINPGDKDYGASLMAGREAVVADTIDDLYFWSNGITLLLLCGSAAVILLQLRSADKKEVITAFLITELWNGRVSDRIELESRTARYNELVEAHNVEIERALTLKAQSSDQAREAAGNLTRSVQKLIGKEATAPRKGAAIEVSASFPNTPAKLEGPDPHAKESHLLLQRQLEATRNSEQNLKQRLNQTILLLDQERRRNATLKGA